MTDEERKELLRKDVEERTRKYPPAIMDPASTDVPRLSCPRFPAERYEHLKAPIDLGQKKLYYFALNLRQCHYILPRLLGSIVEAIRFLGPRNSVLSIVKGNSDDGTAELLKAIRQDLEALGIVYHYQRSDIDPNNGSRILRLAELRNLAMEPLVNSRQNTTAIKSSDGSHRSRALNIDILDDATVAFINDVSICPDDILELIHQRKIQKADMTCGMDWSWNLQYQPFYDVWVARQLNGDSFFEIKENGEWHRQWELFHNDPPNQARYDAGVPVQVFSCWNGGAVFSAQPFLDGEVRFRDRNEGECLMGEPDYLNKDLWHKGRGRFAIVPTVNLGYNDDDGKGIKHKYGYVTDVVKTEEMSELPLQIPWVDTPPEKIKCMPGWKDQSWVPWNETLV